MSEAVGAIVSTPGALNTVVVVLFLMGGVGGVLALVVFYFARQDAKEHRREWAAASKLNREIAVSVLEVVRDNTAALTEMMAQGREGNKCLRELRTEVNELRKERSNGRAGGELLIVARELTAELKKKRSA